ncbi:hypothetical protein BC941DRAFT_455331 [Chlamydoabsidia padenii]|nr:hypothetical protein BC941DRAFT_455331 [Chlamydoabsidia padenii]
MTTRYSPSLEEDAIDTTLIPSYRLYIDYIHSPLLTTLRFIITLLYYCFLGLFKLLFIILRTILWPVYTIGRFFIVPPVSFIYHLCRGFYPIVIFLSVAVICGIVIGCCAGFTAEALSSFFINATWGPQVSSSTSSKELKEQEQEDYLDDDDSDSMDDDDYFKSTNDDDSLDTPDYDTGSGNHHKDINKRASPLSALSSPLSSISSLWTSKHSFDEDGYSEDDHSMADSYTLRPSVPFRDIPTARNKGKQSMQHRPSMATQANTTRYRYNQQAQYTD